MKTENMHDNLYKKDRKNKNTAHAINHEYLREQRNLHADVGDVELGNLHGSFLK